MFLLHEIEWLHYDMHNFQFTFFKFWWSHAKIWEKIELEESHTATETELSMASKR